MPIKANFKYGSFYSLITLIAQSTTFCGMLCYIFTKKIHLSVEGAVRVPTFVIFASYYVDLIGDFVRILM